MPSPERRLKIISVVGARPNFVKIASFLRCLEQTFQVDSILVHTGQHYDASLSQVFFDQLGIRAPDVNMEVGSRSHAQQTAAIMIGFEPILEREKPDAVVVVGDVNSTLACALTARKMQIPVVHIEAGLRSGDENMPEEVNRRVVDLISELYFTTSPEASEHLHFEHVAKERVHFVGNLMIDSLLHGLAQAKALDVAGTYGLKAGQYALLTLHRPSNVDDPKIFMALLEAFRELHKKAPLLFVAHPRTRRILVETGIISKDQLDFTQVKTPFFTLIAPVGYLEMINLQLNARLVMTDSGGMQEETTVLGVPCLTLRENTERPETVTVGTNQVIGTNPQTIVECASAILAGQKKMGARPALWDGHTGERIVRILLEHLRR